jgi:signal transduction histidine kinase/ActR/RegA family two-component response regulator
MGGYPGYQSIEWVDPGMHARWVAPLIGNEADEALDFTPEARRRTALDTAEAMRDVVVTRPIELRQGGRGFLVCVPIFSGKTFEGFIVGVFRYQELLDHVLNNVAADYWVEVDDDGEAIYQRTGINKPVQRRWLQDEKIILGLHTWDLRVWPKEETVAQAKSPLPAVSLVVGFFVAGLLAVTFYSAQTSQLRARELTATNRQLKKEIADRHEMEEQLRQAQKMEAIGRLAGGVAHDFNNLLMVIRGQAMLSLSSFFPPLPLRRNLEGILKAAERATTLTRQLLAFSRKQVLQPKVLNMNALVAQVAELLPPLLGEDIRVHMILEPELGRVRADPGQLEQVLLNLAVNARDAMPEGGDLTIRTANVEFDENSPQRYPRFQPGPHVILSVTDTGHGMDAETVSHAFEPFFTTKEKNKGTGLGLSTAYGIIEQSGGGISLLSEPGKGTTLNIYFPRTVDPPDEVTAPEVRERSTAGSETILVVEDDDAVRKMTRTFLTINGYKVLEARDAREAIQIVEQHCRAIDLLLTDVVMPGIKGRELVAQIGKICGALPVLYMSAYTEDAAVNNGILDAGTAFIEKPFGPDDLAAKVRTILESSARHKPPATSTS